MSSSLVGRRHETLERSRDLRAVLIAEGRVRRLSAASLREVHQGGTDARVELLVSGQIQL